MKQITMVLEGDITKPVGFLITDNHIKKKLLEGKCYLAPEYIDHGNGNLEVISMGLFFSERPLLPNLSAKGV